MGLRRHLEARVNLARAAQKAIDGLGDVAPAEPADMSQNLEHTNQYKTKNDPKSVAFLLCSTFGARLTRCLRSYVSRLNTWAQLAGGNTEILYTYSEEAGFISCGRNLGEDRKILRLSIVTVLFRHRLTYHQRQVRFLAARSPFASHTYWTIHII